MASTPSSLPGISPEVIVIDGQRPAEVLQPATPEELAAALADAGAAGKAVSPVGGGTKLALGNPPDRFDLAISTRALGRVLHYEPTDLTLSVEAGMPFAELQGLLAEHGQTLPVETADSDRATIGGMIATALAGPRRFGSGSLRDLLIGIAVAYPSGIVAKAGGLVVKNVTGFDLMRLHLGALGTLGVIVAANFKVLPAARDEATLLTEPLSLNESMRGARQVRWDRVRPIAIEVERTAEGWRTAIRIEGRPVTVERSSTGLRDQIGSSTILPALESRGWWQERVERESLLGDDSVLIRCSVSPARSEEMAEQLDTVLSRYDISPELCSISPGLGVAMVRFPNHDSISLAVLQRELLASSDNVTILRAPGAAKAGVDVWGAVPETIAVMRALKQEFDPGRVLNPGRFVDRI